MAETAEEPAVKPTQHKPFCVLKASIHCEGCKRKVKKILSQVHGVDHVDVDTKQQKVTVTGSVDADTLIKKLAKSGKHAQLWPQKDVKTDKATPSIVAGNNTRKDITDQSQKQIDHQRVKPTPENNTPKESHSHPSAKAVQAPAKNINSEGAVRGPVKTTDGESSGVDGGGGGDTPAAKAASDAPPTKTSSAGGVQETKEEDKKNDEGCSTAGAPRTTAAEEEKSNGGEGSSKSGKKKKKKGQTECPNPAESQVPGPPPPANQVPPHDHHHYIPPHHYYNPTPTQPVYAMSYNTAYPTSSYTASYYAAPPPYSSYAYMHPGPETHPPPLQLSDLESNPRQPLDSFEIFSDENPNGCFVM